MNNESESNDLDREVDASMRMFERSKVGQAAAITPIVPARVLWVLDGSPQDETGLASATYLRERFNIETLVLDARDSVSGESELAASMCNKISGARPIRSAEGEAYEKILASLDHHDVDLVIVPCPFGRSFDHVGTDSAGTVIDVLLSRCPKPILVNRRGDQTLDECCHTVSMIVGSECDMEQRAAGWVFGMANEKATVTLNLVIEKEHFENIRSILEAIDPEKPFEPEQFSDALTKTHQTIHAAMAKTATQRSLNYRLSPQAGEIAPPNPLSDKHKMLLVMPLEVDDRFGQGFVQDRIRRSPHPVLVVPGHIAAN
ncbi:universal stress protein [Novipirellula rosea]|uniref:Universal stress protein n=1 Tax=Novipirellula rosea TaxID=1031540 RepID=A0ABP8NC06_9BACT